MKAAIYARVSTTDQHNEIQVRELIDYIGRRGWDLAGIYQDQMSGAKAKRPGLDALMADARLHNFDAVLVWKLDRFGRSLMNCVQGIQELAAMDVRFIAVSQGLDTDQANPTSRLLLHILAAVSEFERELICERVRSGVANAKRNGKALGRPKAVFDRQKALDMRGGGDEPAQDREDVGRGVWDRGQGGRCRGVNQHIPQNMFMEAEAIWLQEYRDGRAYVHLTDEQLCYRYACLLENAIAFDDFGAHWIIKSDQAHWSKRISWVEEEFRFRSLAHRIEELRAVELARSRPPVKAARRVSSTIEALSPGSYIVKFAERRYVRDMLAYGRFRISPASRYCDASLNPAIRDDELQAEIFAPAGSSLSMQVDEAYREIPGILGPLVFRRRCSDFYVFCAAGVFDPRLFDEFQADACQVVRDIQRFGSP
jgi:DNA invertase Pin-like site-specific DNA recombinase